MLIDATARKVISDDITSNLMVEAGAGSGKTEEMGKRIVSLVKSGYREINEIVAITFTRKAANELRERVRKLLRNEYDKSKDEKVKKALDHIHECFIGTIHSFCSKLLRERPIEAGIDPGFELIDDGQDDFIRQDTWETFVMQAGKDENELLKQMDVFNVEPASAMDFLKRVCDNQDVEFILPNENKYIYEDMITSLKNGIDDLYKAVYSVYDHIPSDVLNGASDPDGLQKSLIKFDKKVKRKPMDDFTENELINILKMFSTASSIKVTQKRWGESKEEKLHAKGIGQLFENLCQSNLTPLIKDIDSYVYNSILIPFVLRQRSYTRSINTPLRK